jgi:hypothetical protein
VGSDEASPDNSPQDREAPASWLVRQPADLLFEDYGP